MALVLITGCSTMGHVAKGTFISAKEIYAVQPEAIRKSYPQFMQKTFFTAELLTTDYDDWRIRIVSTNNLEEYFRNNSVTVELEYELDFNTHNKVVELIYEGKNEFDGNQSTYFYDFYFSESGKEFWEEYQSSLYQFDKPWFTYQLSPQLPIEIKAKVIAIRYKYAPTWGYLSLREFMELFDLNTDKKWDEFCFLQHYSYDDSEVCGDVRLDDSPLITESNPNITAN